VDIEEIKERHTAGYVTTFSTPMEVIAQYGNDVKYLLSINAKKDEILKSLAYTVLSDFSHMSEYHIKSTIIELAKKAEILCEMDIKTRATDEAINEYWELGD
jgi:hypothetical protein